MGLRQTSAALCLSLLFAVGQAQAQPPPNDNKTQALELFKQSKDEYRVGDFNAAAATLERAHALHPEPVLLYNLARAYEGLGELESAANAYERYLTEAPEVQDRPALERKVENLRAQVERQRLLQQQAVEPAPEELGPQGQPADAKDASGPSPWPWVVVGVGVVGVGVGAALGGLAAGKHSDAKDEPVGSEAEKLQDSAESLAVGANLAFIGGGLITAVGVAWAIADLSGGDDEPTVVIGPGSFGIVGRF